MREPALIREITLSGFAGDSSMLDPANWPPQNLDASESAGGVAIQGHLETAPSASGFEFWVLLVDGSGNEITPAGQYSYRVVEKFNESDSSGTSQARTFQGSLVTGAQVGEAYEHVKSSKGVGRGPRKLTVSITGAISSLPGLGETKAQIWARSV